MKNLLPGARKINKLNSIMLNIFPETILHLPEADIPIKGAKAYLHQSESSQILFMEFTEDVDLPEHSHKAQWGIVLEGKITLKIDNIEKTYSKGDRYYIPTNVKHSGKIQAGYADMTFFEDKDRYKIKQT